MGSFWYDEVGTNVWAPCGLFLPVGATGSHGQMALCCSTTCIFVPAVTVMYYTRILRRISSCEWYGV